MTGILPLASNFEELEIIPSSYSAIVMSQILEHAFDCDAWVKKAYKAPSPGGILAIALPNFDSFLRHLLQENDPYIIPPAHLNFFNQKSLSRLLEKHSFKVERMEEITRINPRIIVRKLPFLQVLDISIVDRVTSVLFTLPSALRCGMMIHAYARKA